MNTLKLSAQPKNFSFEIESKALEQAIQKITAVLTAGSKGVKGYLIAASGKQLYVVGHAPDTYAYILLTSIPDGDGCFSFDPQVVTGLIKNRGQISIAYVDGDVKFKALKSKYSGDFRALQFSDELALVLNSRFSRSGTTTATLSKKTLLTLREGVGYTAVKDVFTDSALLTYMTLTPKGLLTVTSYDKYHFGMFRARVTDTLAFKIAMPSSHFGMIDRMLETDDVKLAVSEDSVRVDGNNFVMILPSMQTDDQSYTLIPDYLKEIGEPQVECQVSGQNLDNMVNNLFTLRSDSAKAVFTISTGQGLDFKFQSTLGSASDSIQTKVVGKKTEIRIEPRILKDLAGLSKQATDLKFGIIPNKIVKLEAQIGTGKLILGGALE